MKKSLYLLSIAFISLKAFGQDGKHILILNKHQITFGSSKIEINNDGFPKYIFSSDQLLYEPIHFHYFTSSKTQEKLVSDSILVNSSTGDHVGWSGISHSDNIKQGIEVMMSANGLIKFKVKLTALKNMKFSNIAFHIPFNKSTAKYLYGLSEKNYLRPDTVRWRWDSLPKIKPSVWIGNANGGLYLSLNARKYNSAPAIQNGWAITNRGQLQINIKGSSMLYEYSTGDLVLKEGDMLLFDFNLIIDPAPSFEKLPDIASRFRNYQKLDFKNK